jgi:hypothetical protein
MRSRPPQTRGDGRISHDQSMVAGESAARSMGGLLAGGWPATPSMSTDRHMARVVACSIATKGLGGHVNGESPLSALQSARHPLDHAV